MFSQSVIGSDDLEWVIIGLTSGKQRNSIELLSLKHIEFALKLDEFVIVGLAVEIALGNIIPEATKGNLMEANAIVEASHERGRLRLADAVL